MWRKLVDWYWEWEDEQIAVLEQPSLAANARTGLLRKHAMQIEQLSPVERQQMLAFSLAFRRRTSVVLGTLVLVFTLVGALLHVVFPKLGWVKAIIVGNVLGFILVFGLVVAWFSYRKLSQRKLRLFLSIALAALGCTLVLMVTEVSAGKPLDVVLAEMLPRFAGATVVASLLFGAPLILVTVMRNRQYETLTAQLQRDAERERLARELSESQLRLLRAQIEPHFLFNTLGAVQQLAEHNDPRAAQLTANLIAFLRASFTEMRSERVSLEAEFGLVEAYLRVMQVRLGARLAFTLTLPDTLAQVRVPSMILLTLAENSIKHGIEPSLRGGVVSVSAEALGDAIRIRVQDSGVGMSATPGTGTGLENLRHRLQLSYGDAACLALHDADPGVIADITIPNRPAQA